jgi:LmbE family N-acetylglucosaminyl deacetylase
MLDCGSLTVIGPHPDDEVIGCGGLLARARRSGIDASVVCVACEDDQRQGELMAACSVLGVAHVSVLFPDVDFIDGIGDADIVTALDEVLDDLRPDLVAIPSMAGYHNEHRRIADLAVSACRPGGGRTYGFAPPSVLYYEAPADVSSPTGAWSPTIYVELSRDDLSAKLAAMSCHASQMRESPSERSLDALDALARLRGMQVGVRAAEAFAPRRLLV